VLNLELVSAEVEWIVRNGLLAPKPLVAHAISDLAGKFLSIDDAFCEIVGRERSDVLQCSIIDLTAEPFRPLNARKLDVLRESGTSFSIEKTYIQSDGRLQAVRNSVSLLADSNRGSLLAATVVAMPVTHDLAASVQAANALLTEQKSRLRLGENFYDTYWRLLLAAYIAEVQGTHGWANELSTLAGGNAQENLLGIWHLVQQGALVVDGEPTSLESASVQLSSAFIDTIESHLKTIQPRANLGNLPSSVRVGDDGLPSIEELNLRQTYINSALTKSV
jgi:PAS domain S-box-containing protein